MVDAERLGRLLRRAGDRVATLRNEAARDPADLLRDEVRLDHVKYVFVTAIEDCVDAAQHVCAAEGWGPPDSNAAAMAVLAKHGVLPAGPVCVALTTSDVHNAPQTRRLF